MAGAGPAAVAAGHEATAGAAREVLAAGGNAFDAVIAAHFAACVAEPLLISLGGGGFLLARLADGEARLYDFFAHTPRARRRGEVDLHAVQCDFGDARQTFHVGMGSIAVPGTIKGLFTIHRHLARLPMSQLVAPAIALAREGLIVTPSQAVSRRVVDPIVNETAEARRLFGAIRQGGRFRLPELAPVLAALADEGDALFYRGELGRRLIAACAAGGGHLREDDLRRYRVIRRRPLRWRYRRVELLGNPPPARGGLLIAFALELLAALPPAPFGSRDHLLRLLRVMARTEEARDVLAQAAGGGSPRRRRQLALYRRLLRRHAASLRGTTHVSVADRFGNLASLSMTNGEGSGFVLPGTGIMLNNMLGEADVRPGGGEEWPADRRLASMMAPAVARVPDGRLFALGSGGSSRIRTAILQVLVNLLDGELPLADAVARPRFHLEGDQLDVEPGLPADAVEALAREARAVKLWSEQNMFFGGVHAVELDPRYRTCRAAGDPRRGGCGLVIAGPEAPPTDRGGRR
ncbi:MAG: Gamma-glutamyltranspeptidase [Acidobacteria bacterium]|nr:MAG: Gamma-glutamyltranspeptidase [Acidobacteriota bacterium]